MTQKANKKPKPRAHRVRIFANNKGQVFLRSKSGIIVEVKRPVHQHLADAHRQLRAAEKEKSVEAKRASEMTPEQSQAHEEIEATLYPLRKGRWSRRVEQGSNYFLIFGIALLLSAIVVALPFKGIELSSNYLPEALHIFVLALYGICLVLLLMVIGTEENRTRYRLKVDFWLGPYGMLVLPFALLFTSAGFLASITYRLHNRGLVVLENCTGRVVTEGGLVDFYMWHFLNLVPLVQLTSLIKRGAPYCYQQSRVGGLILVFQALVVIPSFNTVRFYWKNRNKPSDFLFDPDWNLK